MTERSGGFVRIWALSGKLVAEIATCEFPPERPWPLEQASCKLDLLIGILVLLLRMVALNKGVWTQQDQDVSDILLNLILISCRLHMLSVDLVRPSPEISMCLLIAQGRFRSYRIKSSTYIEQVLGTIHTTQFGTFCHHIRLYGP